MRLGSIFYLGKDCEHRHGGIRYAKSTQCLGCIQSKNVGPRPLLPPGEARRRRLERKSAWDAMQRDKNPQPVLGKAYLVESLELLPKTKTEALRSGVDFFVSAAPCPKNHVSPRYAKGGRCVLCTKQSNAEKMGKAPSELTSRGILSIYRQAAVASGDTKYESDRPCPRGHLERFTASNNCVQCSAAASDRLKDNNRWSRMRRKYGIGEAEYNAIGDAQDWHCPICAIPLAEKNPHVDHCHKTGKVRGLLCGECNQGLGLFKENPDRMLRAIQYIEFHARGTLQ